MAENTDMQAGIGTHLLIRDTDGEPVTGGVTIVMAKNGSGAVGEEDNNPATSQINKKILPLH